MKQQCRSSLKGIVVLVAGLALTTVAGITHAEGWYVGIGAGQATSDADTDGITFLSGPGPISVDETDSSFKVFGGYQFNKYLGVEVGYIDMGETSATAPGPDTYKFALTGFEVAAMGTWPISEKFSLFGKLGLVSWNSDVTFNVSGIGGSVSENGTDAMVGAGAQYNFTKNLGVRAEVEVFDIDEVDAGAGSTYIVSLGAMFRF
jgi:OmpA-OmpF porin, OOP family